MNKIKLLVFLLLSFFLTLNIQGAAAYEAPEPITPPSLIDPNLEILVRKIDPEAEILAKYLEKHNSPLQYHAQDFVDAARIYELDWKLVAAISGVESTFGKHIPGGYNGWGWGVYGTQALYFDSWADGIYTVSRGLKEDYISRGLTNPYSMNKRYAASPRWGRNVTFFMNEIERFAKEYEKTESADVETSPTRVAVSSGLLTYNSQ